MPSPPRPPNESDPGISEPPAWARADLVLAVRTALHHSGSLLTRGEALVCRRFLGLPPAAASLYARLHGRRGVLFALAGLEYADVGDVASAASVLVEAGFAWRGEAVATTAELAALHTVPALRRTCRDLGRDSRGRRSELLARLTGADARPLVSQPSLRLRHPGLFRRLARLFLGRGDGDLSRLVVERLEVVSWVPYAADDDARFFAHRRDLLRYEAGLAVDLAMSLLDEPQRSEALVARIDEDRSLVAALPPGPPWLRRFSARRLALRRLLGAAAALERQADHARAATLYAELLDAGLRRPGQAVHRRALCLSQLGRHAEGAALCQAWLPRVSGDQRLALARTGRRLARKARVGWAPLPPLRQARQRRIRLAPAAMEGPRPGWSTDAGAAPLEAAVVAWLAGHGRRALHGENDLWRMLFGLLMVDLMFAPVPGMLPSPFRSAPLDLGTEAFAAQRAEALAQRLSDISAGGGPALLAAHWQAHHGQVIRGVAWDRYDLDLLVAIVDALGGAPLAAVLDVLARDWRLGARGLPDLLILPGPELRLAGSFPSRLPCTALLAELKGPTDQVRDAQLVWFDRLLEAGLPVELWQVERLDQGASRSGRPAGPAKR